MKDKPNNTVVVGVANDVLSIDEHQLNRECIRLPNQYRQAAWKAAETDRDLAELKARLDVRESELRLKIRNSPQNFKLDKITEGTIAETVRVNAKIQELEKEIRNLKHQQDLERAMVSALETKKRCLTNLVELHVAGYHAEVRPSAAGRAALDESTRKRQSRPLRRDEISGR